MSSFVEKILFVGFGATICLTLFSMIAPILEQLKIDSEKPNYNSDVYSFYELTTMIKRNSKNVQQFPDNQYWIHQNFSIANSIQFTIVNKKTLNLELEFDNQVFVEIIEFQVNIT